MINSPDEIRDSFRCCASQKILRLHMSKSWEIHLKPARWMNQFLINFFFEFIPTVFFPIFHFLLFIFVSPLVSQSMTFKLMTIIIAWKWNTHRHTDGKNRGDWRNSFIFKKNPKRLSYFHVFNIWFSYSLSPSLCLSHSRSCMVPQLRNAPHSQKMTTTRNEKHFQMSIKISSYLFLMLILAIAHKTVLFCFFFRRLSSVRWRHGAIDAITNHLERCTQWLFGFLLPFHVENENRMKNQRAQDTKKYTGTPHHQARDNQISVKNSFAGFGVGICCMCRMMMHGGSMTDGYSAHSECKWRLDADKPIIIEQKYNK